MVWTVRAHAGSSPPFLGRERAAVDVDVERGDFVRCPRETMDFMIILLKRPRSDMGVLASLP